MIRPTLTATFTNAPGGTPVDPTSVTVVIDQDATLVAGPFTYPAEIDREDVGLYSFDVPDSIAPGTYTVKWSVVIAGVTSTGYEVFTIEAATITSVSPEDVATLTGVTLTSEDVVQALSILELYTSMDLSNFTVFGARDRKWISRAVVYQSAWMKSQPGYFGRTDFAAQSQDGLSFTTRDANTMALAPLAQKALSRVSVARPRTIYVRPGRQTQLANAFRDGRSSYTQGSLFPEDDLETGWL